LHFSRLAKTCGECHEQEAVDLEESVHGKALAEGRREAPTCTDCHSEHRIEGLAGSTPDHIAADVCSNCHASERLNTKYRLPPDRVRTFMESYHGLASKYGSTLAANCGSCHGYHRILPSSDPASTIYPKNLVKTCGKCHPGAGENFALSKVHVDAAEAGNGADLGQTVNWWVRRIYLVLIFLTIGGMLLHNWLTFYRKVRDRYRQADHSVIRMDFSQRAQHMTLAVSFIILAITGFALRFPESWVSKALGSNEAFRSWTHRIAGVVMLLVGVYHLFYLISGREGRRFFRAMLPVRKDIKDLTTNAKYLTGLSQQKARIGRFGYSEKVEYWAVVWGTIIMGATGLAIWFKMDVTRFLPRWAVSVATTIHYYEAVLACLAILVWHFYHVMFDPDVYPMNWAAWNGKVSREWQAEEHPLEEDPKHLAKGSDSTKKGASHPRSGKVKQ
jgi:formate dehydrogenase gamma subunit